MFMPRFNFPEEAFSRIGHKVQKYVLVKISSTKIFIYDIYNRSLRNDARSMLISLQKKKKMNKESLLISFCFRYKFQRSF